MNVSINSFKVKPVPGMAEVEKLRKENAMLRQMVDAGMLSSHPGGLKKRNKHPSSSYDDALTYSSAGFGLTK